MTSLQQWVAQNAVCLRTKAAQQMRPLHTPEMPRHPGISDLLRSPIGPQADLITAAVKGLRKQKDVTLATEMSTGKTYCAIAICHCLRARRILVACPPHLVRKWKREIEATVPGAVVTVITGGKQWIKFATESKRGVDSNQEWERHRESSERKRKQTHDSRQRQQSTVELLEAENRCRHECTTFCVAPVTSLKLPRGGVSPARLIKRRLKNYFDVLILDESHQLKGKATRAGKAAHHLISAAKKVVLLTGTLTAGRAHDLFPTLFRLIPGRLKALGYGPSDTVKFSQKYGRIETTVITQPGHRGARTLRRKTVRPGIMPSLFGDLMADRVLFLSLRDMGASLPAHHEQAVALDLPPALRAEYDAMALAILTRFKQLMRDDPREAMRSLAASAEKLLTWPDLRPGPKEDRLKSDVEAEIAMGRQVWVFTTRERVWERLATVLAPHLPLRLTTAVSPLEREDWIREHGPKTKVIISHPKLVETGLELFGPGFNFATHLWHSTGLELNVLRQASARHWRLGQTLECKTLYYYYRATAQDVALKLMAKKLAAAKFLEGRYDATGLVDEDDDGRLDLMVIRQMAEALLRSAA